MENREYGKDAVSAKFIYNNNIWAWSGHEISLYIILIDDGDLLRLCGRIVINLIFYCVPIDIPLHIALNKTHWNCCHP
jgi:hypothetical protein